MQNMYISYMYIKIYVCVHIFFILILYAIYEKICMYTFFLEKNFRPADNKCVYVYVCEGGIRYNILSFNKYKIYEPVIYRAQTWLYTHFHTKSNAHNSYF